MKKVLILGATSAIAQAVAKIYAHDKAELVLVGRNSQLLDVLRQDLEVRGASKVYVFTQDLNDLSAHEVLIEKAYSQLRSFDVVLLAHGILGEQNKAQVDLQEMMNIFNSNFVSHASLLNSIAEIIRPQGQGSIAVLSSVAGDRGKQSNYIYGAAKAAKSTFVDGLRNRLFAEGIHVINFKLGFVDTPMTKDFKKGPLWAQPDSIAKGIVQAIDAGKDTVYLPFFWKFIMCIIKAIPERIFKRLRM